MIHGWGFDNTVFAPVLLPLEKYFTVTTLNMPGYGKNETYMTPVALDDIADTLIPKITAGCILGGWSLGGMVATRICAKLENMISALVLIASPPCFTCRKDWPYGVERSAIEKMIKQIQAGEKDRILNEFTLLVAAGDCNARKVIRILHSLAKSNTASEAVLIDGLNILADMDLRDDLQKLTCPVVSVLAEQDSLVPVPAGNITKLSCQKHRTVVLPSTGHAPFISRPEEFTSLLMNKLQEVIA